MQIILTNDVTLLIISGKPFFDELFKAWENILDEFADIIKTEKSDTVFECHKKIVYTKWKIDFIAKALEYLKTEYDEDIAARIAEIGYDFITMSENREEYLRQIYMVDTEAKSLVVMLNQYNNEYKMLCPEGDAPADRTEMDYLKELAILSKFMGQRIDKDKVTVLEFGSIVNVYLDYAKTLNNGGASI